MHPLRIVASLGVVCVVATLPFQALRAQSAASRQLIAGFADSVNVLPTLRAVDSVATKWSDKQPGGMNEIRRGLLEWHEGHLSGERDHYEAAVSQFERAARRARVWPYPWYLLGRMRLEMLTSGFKVSGVTQQRGAPYLRYYDEARRNLDRSLELDPTFGPTLQFRKQFAAWFAWLDGDVKASFEDATPEGVGLLLGQAPVPGPTWTRPNVAAVGETGAPDARRALEALRDTLAGIMVIADLPSTAVPWSPTRTARDSVWLILRSAFIAFRAADLTDDTTRYLHARERFREARNRLPGLPYGWYGDGISQLAIRRLAMANRVPEPAAGYEPYYLPGMESVHRSLELDPGFRPAMKLLLTMATEESDRTHDPWIIDAVARLSRIDSTPPPDAFLVLARDRRLADDLVAAREALSRYLAVGGDAGVAALERARLLAADSSYDRAADAYRDGLRALSPRARTLYRRDLAWVAEPEDLATFDGVALDSLAGWIRWFWTKRDAEAVRPPGTRLREHLRRWAHVEREYRVGEPRFRAPLNPPLLQDITLCSTELERMTLDDVGIDTPTLPSDLRGWEPIFDHRAAVYMRHGPPVRRIWQFLGSADKLEIPGAPGRRAQTQGVVGPDFDNPLLSPVVEDSGQLRLQPTLEEVYGPTGADAALLADSTYLYRETWSYFFAGRLRLVTFRGSAALGPGPTTLVPVLPLDATYLEAVTTLGNPYGRDFARARHDATVRREARATGVSSNRATPSTRCTMAGARLEESVAEDFQTAAKTDSYTLLFPKDLDPGAVAFGMPSENGGNEGTVLGAFSVPIHNLRIDSTADGGRTTALRIRVTATDRADHRALIRDTLRTFSLPAGGTRGGTLSGLVEIPAPPGRYDMRVAVQLPDSSAGNAIEIPQAVEVWRPDGELRVSDLVTGGDAGNLRWSYGGENVAVHPATAFGRGATVELFYVQGGLRVGETYETAIAVTRAGKTAAVVSVRFEEEARLTVERKRRGLALRDVEPGEYDLTLTLREVGRDRVTSHTRRITVAD